MDIDQEKLKSVREENLVNDTLLFDRAGDVEAISSLFNRMFLGKKLHVVFDFVNSETTCSSSTTSQFVHAEWHARRVAGTDERARLVTRGGESAAIACCRIPFPGSQ